MKTPEQMAQEYSDQDKVACDAINHAAEHLIKDAFLAGYQAAKDEDKAKMQELQANWTFCCEDKHRLIKELAALERALDQFADTGKVMNSPEKQDSCEHILHMEQMVDVNSSNNSNGWISVKERLPEEDEKVKILINYFFEGTEVREVAKAAFRNGLWLGDKVHITHPLVSHWMPLPKPPEEA